MGATGHKLPPPGLPQAGQVLLDRYRVERLVGTGGMAHVLAAKHVALGHDVAIKILDPTLVNDSDARERFSREARAMATLSSKHTVRVFDVGALPNGLPFMVMELLIGHDLHQELLKRGPLPLAEACGYIEQACQAVAEAHAAGIIHRDIKPQNMFLTMTKGKPVIRVLDFGIARTTSSAAAKFETITRMGDVVGTLQYMSPEQIKSSSSVDPRSDVWSLGACLYKLITGWPPFPQAGEAPLMSAILTAPPKAITDYRKDVPAIMTSVILRCLRKPPEERFPNAIELRKALEEVMTFLATDDLDEKTDVMASAVQQKATMKSPGSDARQTVSLGTELPVPPDTGQRNSSGFNKTMPLDGAMAQRLMAEYSAKEQQQQRDSVPHPLQRPVTPSQPMLPVAPAPNPRSAARNMQQTRPGQQQRRTQPSTQLSFLMIVAAVAIGVFIAGIGLFVVLSRHR